MKTIRTTDQRRTRAAQQLIAACTDRYTTDYQRAVEEVVGSGVAVAISPNEVFDMTRDMAIRMGQEPGGASWLASGESGGRLDTDEFAKRIKADPRWQLLIEDVISNVVAETITAWAGEEVVDADIVEDVDA